MTSNATPDTSVSLQQTTLVDPPVEVLLAKAGDSKFTLVVAASSRARDITEYYNGLGQGHGSIIPPQVHIQSNKSLSTALAEIYEDRLVVHRITPEEREAAELALSLAEPAPTSELDAFSAALKEA